MKRAEVWRVRLPSVQGHAQAGMRPAVIVQEDGTGAPGAILGAAKLE